MPKWPYGTLTDLQFASKFICRFIIGERAFYSNEVENPFGGYVGMLLTELNNLDIGGVIPESGNLKEVLCLAGQDSMLQEPFRTLCTDKNKET